MRLTFVTHAPLCSGAEEHIQELSSWLWDHEGEVSFLVRKGGILEKTLPRDRFKVYPIDRDGVKALLSINQAASAIIKSAPDVISINREHDVLPTYLALKLASPFLSKKPGLVSVFHTPTGRKVPFLGRMDGIIFTSEYTKNSFLRTNPGVEDLSRVINYGITLFQGDRETKENPHRERKYFRGRGFPIIGMVGELWKNQVELVETAAHLLDSFPSLTVAIIGGGNRGQVEEIEERAKRLGVKDNLILTGRVEKDLIPQIFYDLDLSVSTHRNEGFGIVHIESLASFTPVVAYKSGGYVEMLEKGGGVLVEGGANELAAAISRLLLDDSLRRDLGRKGRSIVEKDHTVDVMGENHLRFYRAIGGTC